jgi:GT2 family glycosyltransferase
MEHTKYVDYKLLLMANEPDEQTKKIMQEAQCLDGWLFNDRIDAWYNDTNTGSFSSNNNELAQEAQGKYLCFLNDDCYPIAENENWLYSMVQVLETDETVGAVGALLLYPNKTIQHCGVFFSQRTNNLPFHLHYKQPIDKVAGFIGQYRYYQAITAACMLVRRDDFLALGGFDEGYFYMYEDIDLCLKFKTQLNKRCIYCPEAVLVHNEGISGTNKNPKIEHNIRLFKDKWGGKYFDDLMFYQTVNNYMVYKKKMQKI